MTERLIKMKTFDVEVHGKSPDGSSKEMKVEFTTVITMGFDQ